MKNNRTPNRRKQARNIIILILIVLVLFIFRGRIVSSYSFFDGVANEINFKLVNVKSLIYEQTLKLKTKIQNITYLEEYTEKNKKRDFELQKIRVQNMELENLKKENEKLRSMLDMKSKNNSEYIAADVISVENLNSSERIFINKGTNDGLELNFPVMYDGYLIGKISKLGDTYAEVILLTSKKSRISVVLNKEHMQILRGNGNGTFSIFNYNENVSDNAVFDIDTSGTSDVFPRGLRIGTFIIKELNAFKQLKELRFKPSYNAYDIQNVLVYKWDINNNRNREIQEKLNDEIQEEFQKNKGTSQTN
ncbi:MAG: rod shape-determining protein MreC [Leptotrichiaceae bacterium]|nr:rod shape-determining protein MreC [Leptotrichiaceae bacterium]MBP7100047.1 rod shape-determining protein MreC [Leptotrichiaceae bacterium]MBP7725394.1 rod shape-determining protein MreC [Leptotrichiaceae bacterium]MBP9628970.1 rod shape-determining protein MreC [Leptotrichiaceae bacterium]